MRCFEQGRYIYWHCPIQNTLRDRDDLQSLAWSTQVITDVKQRPLCKYTLKIAYYENFKNNHLSVRFNRQFTVYFNFSKWFAFKKAVHFWNFKQKQKQKLT